jgi:hypothetical protein
MEAAVTWLRCSAAPAGGQGCNVHLSHSRSGESGEFLSWSFYCCYCGSIAHQDLAATLTEESPVPLLPDHPHLSEACGPHRGSGRPLRRAH